MLPLHLQTEPALSPLTPDQPVLARVEIPRVPPRLEIRIWIYTPSTTGSFGFDQLTTPAVNRIWHDAEHQSSVVFGELAGVKVPAPRAACNTLLHEPGRPDPIPGQLDPMAG